MFGAMVLGIAAMMAAPHAGYAGSSGIVTGTAVLNLRSCADVSCARIAVMPSGAQVSVDGASGSWYHVSYNGTLGYASAGYISTSGSVTAAPAPVAAKTVKKPRSTPAYPASDSGGSGNGSGGNQY